MSIEAYERLITNTQIDAAIAESDSIYQYIYEQVPGYAEEQADRSEAGIFSLEEYPYRCAKRKTGRYQNAVTGN